MVRYNVVTPITPSDTANLTKLTDAIYVGGAGDVAVVLQNGVAQTFAALAAGSVLPVAATRVNATATTASALLALYQV